MLEPRIQQHFFESADLLYQAAESLARPIADAAQAATGCLTAGGRLLVYAGRASAWGAWLCDRLVSGFERERPPLAAWLLGGAVGIDPARHLHALGQSGDLLLLQCVDDDPLVPALIEQAHAKEMSVVLFSGSGGDAPQRLRETDVWVAVPHARPARLQEVHLLAMHALCDAIDLQLLGEADPA